MGAWVISVKDLQIILRDRAALFILLALPIVFIAILGMSTGQLLAERDKLKLIKVGFVDEGRSELSTHVFKTLGSIGGLALDQMNSRDEAMRELQDGRIGFAIMLGKEFDDRIDNLSVRDLLDPENGKLSEGLPALDMDVECSASYGEVQDLVKYVVLSAVMQVASPDITRRSSVFARVMNRVIEHRREDAANRRTAKTASRGLIHSGTSIIYQTLVPAFLVLFAFFLVNIMASSFIVERERGTLTRIQATRISPVQLMCGKTLPFLIISIVQSLLLFLSGKILFGMSWGTYPILLIPVILLTSLCATGLGLIVATFVRTESQVASYSTFLVVVLAGISGCYMPRDWLPVLMKQISLVTPHAWALIAYQELLTREHPNLRVVTESCCFLAIIAGVCFVVGGFRFRKIL